MKIDFGWFLPTMGDSEVIGPPTREATVDYLTDVARAAEDAGFNFALIPVGTTCQDAWLVAALVGARTDRLKFLVAMRPGFVSPTVAAKMSNTLDQQLKGRVLINVVTGGFPVELNADGDFLEHDERYERTQEFMQVVREAWTNDKKWDHEGKYFKVAGGNVFPRPYQQPHPPFYFGGASDMAKKVGAEDTDVYLLWGEPVEMVRERIEDMKQRAAAVGRTLRFGLRIHVVTPRDRRRGPRRGRSARRRDPGPLPGHDDEAPRRAASPRARSASASSSPRRRTAGLRTTSGRASARRGSAWARRSSAPARASPGASRSTSTSGSTRSSSRATRTSKRRSASAST